MLSFPLTTSALIDSGTPNALLISSAIPAAVLSTGTVIVNVLAPLILIENVSPSVKFGLETVPVTAG